MKICLHHGPDPDMEKPEASLVYFRISLWLTTSQWVTVHQIHRERKIGFQMDRPLIYVRVGGGNPKHRIKMADKAVTAPKIRRALGDEIVRLGGGGHGRKGAVP